MALKDWQKKAANGLERAAPYLKQFGKGTLVHVIVPVVYGLKEIAIATGATMLAGGKTTWEVVLEPFLARVSDLVGWAIDESVKGGKWVWNAVTPWN